ncbi:MAG TPA: TlpA disulfide reductase family protein [Levilinea sp.]|nr:TlpA disulfide reductase family protein [Levilinea sp.]
MKWIECQLQQRWTIVSLALLVFTAFWTAGTALLAQPIIEDEAQEPRPGFYAPDFELLTPQGNPVRLSDLRGRPVILNLWASWCPRCKAEMLMLENVHRQNEAEGLVVLAVNLTYQDSAQSAIQFLNENGLTFPVLMDVDGVVGRRYQVRALPTTFFIDRSGRIHSLELGGPLPEAYLQAKAVLLLEDE